MYAEFQALRITPGNAIFPDRIIVEDGQVTLYKQRLIGHDSIVISRRSIASVYCNYYDFVFADIVIETSGGQTYTLNGFSRSAASEIECLLSR